MICVPPARERYDAGVYSHSFAPVPGSIAIVFPYVVVTTITSRARPRAMTPCSSIAEESTVPSMWTTRVPRRPTLAAPIPMSAGPTPLRCEL